MDRQKQQIRHSDQPVLLLLTWFDLIPAFICNYIHHTVWVEIIYQFRKFNGATHEVCERKSKLTPLFTGSKITYLCWDYSTFKLMKGVSRYIWRRWL